MKAKCVHECECVSFKNGSAIEEEPRSGEDSRVEDEKRNSPKICQKQIEVCLKGGIVFDCFVALFRFSLVGFAD
jgi:hypothetical protein